MKTTKTILLHLSTWVFKCHLQSSSTKSKASPCTPAKVTTFPQSLQWMKFLLIYKGLRSISPWEIPVGLRNTAKEWEENQKKLKWDLPNQRIVSLLADLMMMQVTSLAAPLPCLLHRSSLQASPWRVPLNAQSGIFHKLEQHYSGAYTKLAALSFSDTARTAVMKLKLTDSCALRNTS